MVWSMRKEHQTVSLSKEEKYKYRLHINRRVLAIKQFEIYVFMCSSEIKSLKIKPHTHKTHTLRNQH